MGVMKSFFTRFFHTKELSDDFDTEEELQIQQVKEPDGENDEGENEYEWDWESLTKDRNFLHIQDELQRKKYISSLLEQVHDASGEMDKLSYEYNLVTASLKDMDELEGLPQSEKKKLYDSANRILYFEEEQDEYDQKKNRMADAKFHDMEGMEQYMPKAYDDIHEAEDYQRLVKEDLARLEGEKQSCLYRINESRHDTANLKGMVMICIAAALLCFVMLAVLQFGLSMQTRAGYLITTLAGAVAMTVLFLKYNDAAGELKRAGRELNRIILLLNTVKIRYVNNTNLLDYLYTKYGTRSGRELLKNYNLYQDEKREREIHQQNTEELVFYRGELYALLKNYQLADTKVWLYQPQALMNHNEMVEIRHEYIVRRQKLRARMDYNKRLAREGKKELEDFSKNYPQYAREVITMMDQY